MPRKINLDRRLTDIVTQQVEHLVAAIEEALRQNIASDLHAYLGEGGGRALGLTRRRQIKQCIAPGCTNPSKGPRFHYLCEGHKGAGKKKYVEWRRARREQRGAKVA